ncbi:TetR/AcrR family transcriptional regulator [Streptomyces sp. NPDC002845]
MSSDIAPDRRRTTRELSVREAVLNIALGLHADGVWDRTSMERIASAAGVSRQTLYNTFGDRKGIAQALLWRETDRLLDGVDLCWRRARGRGAEPRDCLVAAMSWILAASHDHPLLHDVLTGHGHQAADLSLLSPRHAPADQRVDLGRGLAAVVGAVAERCRRLDAAEPGGHPDRLRGVEAVVRMTVSYLLLSTATIQARREIAHTARSLLPDSRSPARAPGSGTATTLERSRSEPSTPGRPSARPTRTVDARPQLATAPSSHRPSPPQQARRFA